MTAITAVANPSFDANTARMVVSGLIAGEELPAGAPCQIGADGVYLAEASTDTVASTYAGFTAKKVLIGNPVSLFRGIIHLSASQTPGTVVFLSTTAGELVDALPAVGSKEPIGIFVDASDLLVF